MDAGVLKREHLPEAHRHGQHDEEPCGQPQVYKESKNVHPRRTNFAEREKRKREERGRETQRDTEGKRDRENSAAKKNKCRHDSRYDSRSSFHTSSNQNRETLLAPVTSDGKVELFKQPNSQASRSRASSQTTHSLCCRHVYCRRGDEWRQKRVRDAAPGGTPRVTSWRRRRRRRRRQATHRASCCRTPSRTWATSWFLWRTSS